MLEIKNLVAGYGSIIALHGLSLMVPAGRIVTLIGSNGAGKSTTLKAISGLIKPMAGTILYQGQPIGGMPPHLLVRQGLAHVPEGRMIFRSLTVLENLLMGAYQVRDASAIRKELEFVYATFPRLKERASQMAGTLSGGEQQMLAMGRALMSRPKLLMLDEPSLGLAPMLVQAIFQKIVEINQERQLAILLVEQNANRALEIAHHGYVLETGRVILDGDSSSLRSNPQVRAAYLGGV